MQYSLSMTSTSQLTEEERNFTRFFFLNFKVSPDIARRFFDGVFPPTHLTRIINNNMRAIMSLNKSRRINAAQLEILRGITGTVWPPTLPPMPAGTRATSSMDFDLTLMICLLRNIGGLLTPSNGWDQLPNLNDTLPGADLATMKWYRNLLAHTTVTSMDNLEFVDKWTRVEKALTSLNKGQKPHEVTEILNYDLDGEQAKALANAELNKLKNDYDNFEKEIKQIENDFSQYREANLPINVAEANATLVEKWRKEDETFYETVGSELVYDKVQACSCILVTANSGLGKTATIRHVALKLKAEGIEIVPVEFPEDIIKYKTITKQVFLIDDVFGKYDVSPTLLSKWERIDKQLISCLETDVGSNKILCTLRLQITRHNRFNTASTILNKEVINLEHASNALSKEEKQNILIKHLKKNNLEMKIKKEEVENMCETNYAFPLLCKLVSNDEARFMKRVEFFRQPFTLLKEELNKMSYDNKKLYCILVICMLFNGAFSRSMLINSHEYDAKINRIIQTCGLQRNMSKKELEESAFSALGSYFTMDSYSFRFIHDALEETVVSHFYTFDPNVMLSDCHILFIRDRIRIHSNENTNDDIDENTVVIQEDELHENNLKPIFNRLWNELSEGKFSSLLMSHLFKNGDFVSIFGTYLETNKSILESKFFLKKVSSERIFSYWSRHTIPLVSDQSVSKRKKVSFLSDKYLIDTNDAISRVIEAIAWRSTLIYWIVAFGCYEFFHYAWRKMTTLEQKRILGRDYRSNFLVKSFFPLAVLGGSVDIVKELIGAGADVNCFSEIWETPLYVAVKSGHSDMVRILVEHRAKVNLRGWFLMNIPCAVPSITHELTNLILEHDLNQTELHLAVRHNDLQKLRSNIRSGNIDFKTNSGWTVLHYAVLSKNVEAVKVLVDQSEDFCKKPSPKVSIVDNNGLTAVHLAVIIDNIEILSLLLRNKADVNVRDVFDRTPLHYIKSASATQLLLSHSFQNHCVKTNRNAEEERMYETYGKTQMSAFSTICLNITLRTSFRNVGRDVVNMADRKGDTPLHSVLQKCLLKGPISECIETLLDNGANRYLFNDSGTTALELMESSCDTVQYINNDTKYKQSIQNTYKVFVVAMVFLMSVTFGLSIHLDTVIRERGNTAVLCAGQDAESSNITLVQVKRSINVVFLTIILLWLLSITFHMRYSDLLHRFLFLFLGLILLGCVFFILFAPFAYIKIIYRVMYLMIYIVTVSSALIKTMPYLPFYYIYVSLTNILNCIKIVYCFGIIVIIIFLGYITNDRNNVKFDNFFSLRDINTLDINTLNCSEFRSANFSCTSLAYNVTYKNSVDFSVQCHTKDNFTMYFFSDIDSFNVTYGTLTIGASFIDWSEIGLQCLYCLNLSLHAVCAFCILHCILVFVQKKLGQENNFMLLLNGIAMCLLYGYMLCHLMF